MEHKNDLTEIIDTKFNNFLGTIKDEVFNGLQAKTKEISNLHRELLNKMTSLDERFATLNGKVQSHEKRLNDEDVRNAGKDEQFKSVQETITTVRNLGYVMIVTILVAGIGLLIK